ncbi:Tbc1 domain family member 14 [Mycena sanguinolenta]|uniref:Tbc1 domain family member 14 n=1 Tax=Mycena sanguinolenta TaxID=230812 RepID=A0A8H6XF42_9AGAR|nr:Tbc1 domain family member 14 [Mycena sanguinolenta]
MPLASPPPSLDLDDAFDAEGDDNEADYKFSADAIRQDIARHELSWADTELDTSVSTLDMSGSPPLESSLDEDEMAGQFTQISLSESSVPDEPSNDLAVSNEDESDVSSPHPYPNVIIDVSKLPGHRVTVSLTPELENRASRTSDESPPAAPLASLHILSLLVVLAPFRTRCLRLRLHPSQHCPPPHFQNLHHCPQKIQLIDPHVLLAPSREEDNKHLSEWESMMKQSRITAAKRRRAFQERRMAREKKIEDSLYIWEKEIVPDWKVVHKNATLRKLWWEGIPTKLRASMWANAVGNALALSKALNNYRTCLARAKRALGSGTFPSATLSLIEKDISTTLPSLHIFHHENGPLYADLKDMMFAWVVSRSDEGLGYTLGAAKIGAMLLINMPVQQGFIVMRNLMERHCMRSFFGGDRSKDDVDAYYRIFDTLLADGMPKIYFNFKQHQISPAAYLPDWLLPLFLDHLPFEACARIWDVLLLEGDSFLYRAALGILAVLEPRLFFPDRKELLELLRGENKAAIDVATREGRSLDGGRYEIYGVDEETVWERIDSMHDWWKDSTWARLIQRELPDL